MSSKARSQARKAFHFALLALGGASHRVVRTHKQSYGENSVEGIKPPGCSQHQRTSE